MKMDGDNIGNVQNKKKTSLRVIIAKPVYAMSFIIWK